MAGKQVLGRTAHRRALIVGASMSGLRAAEQLRARGWAGEITVVGDEPHMPYNRPPLSKEILQSRAVEPGAAPDAIHPMVAFPLRPSVADVTWRLGARAVAASLDERVVDLADGTAIAYDALVVATGLRPRRLAVPGPLEGRHVLRTLEDAVGLRRALDGARAVVIVGGGLIGCEVAASARRLGCAVTVVEPTAVPMGHILGAELGSALQRHHEARGVVFRTTRAVVAFRDTAGRGRVDGVVLDDGTQLDADVVVESVGSMPNVEWLAGNGLDLSDGVLTDNAMRVEGRPGVVAVGDVARFPNPVFDDVPRRVEHWSVPTDTAKRAAASIVEPPTHRDASAPFAPLPSFWSDQFELRLRALGAPALAQERELLQGTLDASCGTIGGTVMGCLREGRLVGVLAFDVPPALLMHYRTLLTASPLAA